MQKLQVRELPVNKKKIKTAQTVKALQAVGYSLRDIGGMLGIPKTTIHDYSKMAVEIDPVELDMVRTQIKDLVRLKEDQVASKILKKIEDKLDTAQFGGLVFAYKSIREVQNPRQQGSSSNTTNIQVKVIRESHSDKVEVTEAK